MAMRKDLSAASTVTSLVTSNSRLWTYRRKEQRLSPPAITRLSEIQYPVRVIVGDRDLAHTGIAALIVRGVARGQRVTVPGAGHIVNLDTPGAFNEALAPFLSN